MPRAVAAALLNHLEEGRGAHAAADAHRDDDELDVAALAFQEHMHRHARAAEAIWVTDRDRAAVDVEALVRNAQRVAAVDRLDGERLVEFPQPDVVDPECVTL